MSENSKSVFFSFTKTENVTNDVSAYVHFLTLVRHAIRPEHVAGCTH